MIHFYAFLAGIVSFIYYNQSQSQKRKDDYYSNITKEYADKNYIHPKEDDKYRNALAVVRAYAPVDVSSGSIEAKAWLIYFQAEHILQNQTSYPAWMVSAAGKFLGKEV